MLNGSIIRCAKSFQNACSPCVDLPVIDREYHFVDQPKSTFFSLTPQKTHGQYPNPSELRALHGRSWIVRHAISISSDDNSRIRIFASTSGDGSCRIVVPSDILPAAVAPAGAGPIPAMEDPTPT